MTMVEQTSATPAAEEELPRIKLLGVPIHRVTEREVIAHILAALGAGRGGWVITPNLDQLRLYVQKPELAEIYQEADLILADGMPLVWASRMQGTPLPERVAGSTLILTVTAAAAEAGYSIFLLGGNPGAAEAAAKVLQARHPGLRVAGMLCPAMGFEKDPAQMAAIREAVASARPNIVYSCFGFPKQERVIQQLKPALPGTWFFGLGISLSFISGEVKRAPEWMQRCGLEWVHRMLQEPGRLFKRYIVHDLPFAGRLFWGAWRGRRVMR